MGKKYSFQLRYFTCVFLWAPFLWACGNGVDPSLVVDSEDSHINDTAPADTDSADASKDTQDTAPESCLDPPMEVVVGVGEAAFALVDGATEVVMVHGPQGGWHIDMAFRIGHTLEQVLIHPKITVVSTDDVIAGAEDVTDVYAIALVMEDECQGEIWGIRAFIDDIEVSTEIIQSLEGETLRLSASITDLEGRQGAGEVFVVAALDPIDQVSKPSDKE
jgi:hypothetical protein